MKKPSRANREMNRGNRENKTHNHYKKNPISSERIRRRRFPDARGDTSPPRFVFPGQAPCADNKSVDSAIAQAHPVRRSDARNSRDAAHVKRAHPRVPPDRAFASRNDASDSHERRRRPARRCAPPVRGEVRPPSQRRQGRVRRARARQALRRRPRRRQQRGARTLHETDPHRTGRSRRRAARARAFRRWLDGRRTRTTWHISSFSCAPRSGVIHAPRPTRRRPD